MKIVNIIKRLIDKLINEYTETVDEEAKILIKMKIILAYYKLCCFQYSLQSTLELLLILFTIST